MQGWNEDVYFKKRITYVVQRHTFVFDVAELLFSSHDIDSGSQFLIRQLQKIDHTPQRMLDLGCGYGVLGIVLAQLYPEARVVLSDKDLLAVAYTEHNIALNQISNAQVYASISLDDLPPQRYDLIVSNVPGHIGDRAIEADFVLKPLAQLAVQGSYVVVVVKPLKALIETIAQDYQLRLALLGERAGHSVYQLAPGAA